MCGVAMVCGVVLSPALPVLGYKCIVALSILLYGDV
jgi:hypothetical protein